MIKPQVRQASVSGCRVWEVLLPNGNRPLFFAFDEAIEYAVGCCPPPRWVIIRRNRNGVVYMKPSGIWTKDIEQAAHFDSKQDAARFETGYPTPHDVIRRTA